MFETRYTAAVLPDTSLLYAMTTTAYVSAHTVNRGHGGNDLARRVRKLRRERERERRGMKARYDYSGATYSVAGVADYNLSVKDPRGIYVARLL